MAPREYHVRIGQIEMAGEGEILKTVLGSCVGIALIWKKRKMTVLAHCLLPTTKDKEPELPGRFVSTCIPAMLEKIGATAGDIADLEAIVGGGGRMIEVDQSYEKFVVGDLNLKTAQEMLAKYKIRMVACVSGGDQGTKIRIEAGSGEYLIEKVPKAA